MTGMLSAVDDSSKVAAWKLSAATKTPLLFQIFYPKT
jgi:hypothetical protein